MRYSQRTPRNRQHGSVLIISLLLLVVLTILGVSAMTTSTLEERMAGGSMDQNTAFQAAENALRDAELYAFNSLTSTSAFTDNCSNGLCKPSTSSTNVWDSNAWAENTSVVYGSQTGAPNIPGLDQQPRYIIELLPAKPPGEGQSLGMGKPGNYGTPFRITAVGWGKQKGTLVMLQSIYVKQ